MKFEILRDRIKVIPECEQDVAYIEDTLGLKGDGASVNLIRRSVHGTITSLSHLETGRKLNKTERQGAGHDQTT